MSRRSLGTLTIDLIARTGGFQEGMSRAEREADRATKSISRGSRSASKDVQDLGSSANSSAEFFKRFAAIAGTAIAGIKLTSLIRESADLNSRYEQLGGIMNVVGRNAGLSADQVNRYAKEVQAMGITMLESRQTVISMTQAQLDLSKASDLARVAQDAAAVAGINSTEALGRLINGIQSAQTEILKGVGINVQFERGYRDMAAQLGKTSAELTEAEKAQSRMNQVLAAGADIAGSYESSMDSATKQLGSTARYVEDLKVMWGELFSEANRQLVFQYSDGLKALLGVTEALYQDGRLEEWGESVGRGLDIATDAAQALAVVLGARLAGSLSAVIAAKALAVQQSFAYQAALARMAGVSATAAAGQYALAGAVGAARGALALVGGPVGVAVIAAAGIYKFREELGLVPYNASRAAEEIRRLSGAIEGMNVATAEFELMNANRELVAAENQVRKTQLAIEFFKEELAQEVSPPKIQALEERLVKLRKTLSDSSDAASAWREQIEALTGVVERARIGYSTKEEILAQIAKQYVNAADGAKDLADGTEEATRKSKELERQLQRVLDKLYPQQAAVRDLMAEWRLVSELAPQSAHDWIDANVMIGTTIREAADESVVAVERQTTATERGAERMRDVMGDYFQRIIADGKASFGDLLYMFKRMIAEMIATAAANRIMLGFGLGGASMGALAGGGGGAGGGLLNLASWASTGKTLWSGFQGLATGQGLSGFAGLFGGHAANAALIPQHMLTRAASQQAAAITNFTNTVGPILAGLGGAIQGWQSGNRMNAVTGALGGWGGAKAGAAAGTYFMPGIGTAIGAVLGGILGSSLGSSVFGGSWENRRSGIELGFNDEGLLLQDWIRQTKKGGWFGSTKRRYVYSEMEEALADEFRTSYDTMIDVLGTQFMAIGADLDRAVFEAVKIGSASINTSDQTEEQIQEQIEKWFNDLNAAMIKGALDAAGDASSAVRLLRATGGDSAMLEALGGLMGVAGRDAVAAARAAQTQVSMVESYRTVTEATRELIGEYDGSLDATYALTEAMGIQQELAYGLASAYLQASDAVGLLFGNLSETIRTSLMDAEELYEYQRSQVHSLTDLLGTLTDPDAILRTSEQIERLVSGMWGRLDDSQRMALGDEFLDYVDRTRALAEERLAQGLAEVESTQADVYNRLTTQMDTVAERMNEATRQMQTAAELQYQSSMQFGAYVQQMGSIVQSMGWGMEVNA